MEYMDDIRKNQEFLSYIKTPLSQNSLNVLYSANNVKYERCVLFSEFVNSLICVIMDTYMGDKFTNKKQRLEHFNWCWEKNLNDFKGFGVTFNNTNDLRIYYQQFMVDSFYLSTEKGDINSTKEKLISLWDYILNYNSNKTRSDVDMFLDIYKIFEKTLEN